MSQKKAASKKTARKRARAARKAPPPATGIPADNQLTMTEFMRHLLDGHTYAKDLKKRPFCFILGAGASIQSGIPAARTLVDEWLRDLHSLAAARRRACVHLAPFTRPFTGFSVRAEKVTCALCFTGLIKCSVISSPASVTWSMVVVVISLGLV